MDTLPNSLLWYLLSDSSLLYRVGPDGLIKDRSYL